MVNKADLPLAIAAGQIEEPRTDVLVPEVEGYTTTSTEEKLNRSIQDEVWQLMLTQVRARRNPFDWTVCVKEQSSACA
ncbi:hypothetical protein [Geomicrobium sp. JCM 19039]|uniref:hypothetical protein n=1 Tax=Geomicrobium sp. JCM 19039 TaxID=1460636 RepID=UPI00045F1FE1|nr:hypothetical protein [Geomicrobium sp. JCM 19039]GAK14371.1 hypothetical protein JCM19039_4286 [Geomicrobium sp. JCM 19039]